MSTERIDGEACNAAPSEERLLARRKWALAVSAAICVAVFLCYLWQSDWLVPVTLVPGWCWLAPGLAMLAFGASRRHKRWTFAVLALWLAYVVVLVPEARSLARVGSWPTAEWTAAGQQGRAVRVVSLNCLCANWRAAAEVARWQPDIVFLQESPSSEHLERLARDLFGDKGTFVQGGDCSILARGDIEPHGVDRTSHFVHATVALPSAVTVDVISVRLSPPVLRLDFWTPGCWRDHHYKRVEHRRQILKVMEPIKLIPPSRPLIVGGDFNAPPNDGALGPLRQRLSDTFLQAGRGWGHTGTNDYPLCRVDQIWASPHFRAESVTAQKTIHSDHRMVVCDLIVNQVRD